MEFRNTFGQKRLKSSLAELTWLLMSCAKPDFCNLNNQQNGQNLTKLTQNEEKNKVTLLSSTIEVRENKVSLFYLFCVILTQQ